MGVLKCLLINRQLKNIQKREKRRKLMVVSIFFQLPFQTSNWMPQWYTPCRKGRLKTPLFHNVKLHQLPLPRSVSPSPKVSHFLFSTMHAPTRAKPELINNTTTTTEFLVWSCGFAIWSWIGSPFDQSKTTLSDQWASNSQSPLKSIWYSDFQDRCRPHNKLVFCWIKRYILNFTSSITVFYEK